MAADRQPHIYSSTSILKPVFALVSNLLAANKDQVNMVFNAMEDLFRTVGRPKTLKLCNRELEGILSDFCQKLGVRVSYTKNLPALNRVRKMLVNDMSK